jgi:hypothetical protein
MKDEQEVNTPNAHDDKQSSQSLLTKVQSSQEEVNSTRLIIQREDFLAQESLKESGKLKSSKAQTKIATAGNITNIYHFATNHMSDDKTLLKNLPSAKFSKLFSSDSQKTFREEKALNSKNFIECAESHDMNGLKYDFSKSKNNIKELWTQAKKEATEFLKDQDGLVITGSNLGSADEVLVTQALIHVARENKIPILGMDGAHQCLENLGPLSDEDSKQRVVKYIEQAENRSSVSAIVNNKITAVSAKFGSVTTTIQRVDLENILDQMKDACQEVANNKLLKEVDVYLEQTNKTNLISKNNIPLKQEDQLEKESGAYSAKLKPLKYQDTSKTNSSNLQTAKILEERAKDRIRSFSR